MNGWQDTRTAMNGVLSGRSLVELRAELPEQTTQGLLPLGYEWLTGREDRDGWSFVWQKLVELRAELPEQTTQGLLPLGYEWLTGREGRDAWAFVWQKLVELRADLPKKTAQGLLQLGHEWLTGHEGRDGWSFVWQKLVELRAELPVKPRSHSIIWLGMVGKTGECRSRRMGQAVGSMFQGWLSGHQFPCGWVRVGP